MRREYFRLESLCEKEGKRGKTYIIFPDVSDFINYFEYFEDVVMKEGFKVENVSGRIKDDVGRFDINKKTDFHGLLKRSGNRLVGLRLEFYVSNDRLNLQLYSTLSLRSTTGNLVLCVMGDLVDKQKQKRCNGEYGRLVKKLQRLIDKRRSLAQ